MTAAVDGRGPLTGRPHEEMRRRESSRQKVGTPVRTGVWAERVVARWDGRWDASFASPPPSGLPF